jgi:succinate dehydrogenase hydrophobic anchor subunit
MTYQEKQSIINMTSGVLIAAIYSWIIYQRHLDGRYDLANDFQQWGKIFLIFMLVSIVARIAIYIIFHIINAIATKEEDVPDDDERDKFVKLKATRNSHYAFSVCLFAAFIGLAIGWPVYILFIAFIVSGVASEIIESLSQIYYYRKGV